MTQTFALTLLPDRLAICRLPADAAIPPWAISALSAGGFGAVTRTRDELSVVCAQTHIPTAANAAAANADAANADADCDDGAHDGASDAGLRVDADWRALRVEGPFAFTEVGVLATLTTAVANANIGVFAISTFDTDYLLVKRADADAAIQALSVAGHRVEGDDEQT